LHLFLQANADAIRLQDRHCREFFTAAEKRFESAAALSVAL